VVRNKRAIFVREYMRDMNATRAALSAGYSKKTAYSQGARLLKNVEVQNKLAQLVENKTEKLEITAEYVLSTIKETVDRGRQAVPVLDKLGHETGEWKQDNYAVLKGCELLGKYLELFTERIRHTGQIEHVDLTHISDEQLAEVQRIVESAGPKART
jgi:phage terminase small subunit